MDFYVKDKQIKLGGTHIPIGSIVYSFITDETISIIHEKINYNGLIVNLKKENGSNYADKAELEAVLPDFFKGGTDSGIVFQEVSAPPELVNIPENTLVVDTTGNIIYFKIGTHYYQKPVQEYSGPVVIRTITGDDRGGSIPQGQSEEVVFTIDPVLDGSESLEINVESEEGEPPEANSVQHDGEGCIIVDFDSSSASDDFTVQFDINYVTTSNAYLMTIT